MNTTVNTQSQILNTLIDNLMFMYCTFEVDSCEFPLCHVKDG